MSHQRRAEEGAGALLEDHHVGRLRLEFRADGIHRRIAHHLRLALGGADIDLSGMTLRPDVAGGIEDRDASSARRGEQPLGRFDCLPGIFPAGARMAVDELRHRPVAAGVGGLIKVDGDQSGRGTDEYLARVAGIKLQHLLRHHIFPAMVFEIVRHGLPPESVASGAFLARRFKALALTLPTLTFISQESVGWTAAAARAERLPWRKVRAPWMYGAG